MLEWISKLAVHLLDEVSFLFSFDKAPKTEQPYWGLMYFTPWHLGDTAPSTSHRLRGTFSTLSGCHRGRLCLEREAWSNPVQPNLHAWWESETSLKTKQNFTPARCQPLRVRPGPPHLPAAHHLHRPALLKRLPRPSAGKAVSWGETADGWPETLTHRQLRCLRTDIRLDEVCIYTLPQRHSLFHAETCEISVKLEPLSVCPSVWGRLLPC